MAILLSVALPNACPCLSIPIGGVHWTLEESSDWVDLVSPSSLLQDVICVDF